MAGAPDSSLLEVRAAARDLLDNAGVLSDGWAIRDVFRADDCTVVVDLGPPEGRSVRLGWRDAAPGVRAAVTGTAYAVEFRLAPGTWDPGAAGTPPAVVDRAERAAAALAAAPPRMRLAAPQARRPAVDSTPASLNLGIPGPCGQRCGFCSLYTRGESVLESEAAAAARFGQEIATAAARGTRVLRLNGIEPLATSYTLGLLEKARALGFEAFEVYSTFLPLADADLARRFFAAMPARYDLYVPIYGSTAAVHDAVTHRPGAFDLLRAALDNLRAGMDGRGRLTFTTILTRQNAGDLAALGDLVVALRDHVGSRRAEWRVHLPFPNGLGEADPYRGVVPTMTEALAAVFLAGRAPVADLPLGEVLPCVALDHQARTGHALVTGARIVGRQRAMAGTRNRALPIFDVNRSGGFVASTVPCPYGARCALAPVCTREVYALYAQVHGLAELRPVDAAELAALPDAAAVLAAIRETGVAAAAA